MLTPTACKGTAITSSTDEYRYLLTRTWDPALSPICFVMLNPSTADAERNDPTIRRCIGFAASWGFGTLIVVNLYAYKTARPGELLLVEDPCGPENDAYIAYGIRSAQRTVFAWGCHSASSARSYCVTPMVTSPYCLGKTRDGDPKHPLYVPATTKPIAFKPDT